MITEHDVSGSGTGGSYGGGDAPGCARNETARRGIHVCQARDDARRRGVAMALHDTPRNLGCARGRCRPHRGHRSHRWMHGLSASPRIADRMTASLRRAAFSCAPARRRRRTTLRACQRGDRHEEVEFGWAAAGIRAACQRPLCSPLFLPTGQADPSSFSTLTVFAATVRRTHISSSLLGSSAPRLHGPGGVLSCISCFVLLRRGPGDTCVPGTLQHRITGGGQPPPPLAHSGGGARPA